MKKYLGKIRTAKKLVSEKGGLAKSARTAFRVLRYHGLQGIKDILTAPPPWNKVPDLEDYAFEVPFRYAPKTQPLNACAIVHVFYPELCVEIKKYLENVPEELDVFISTTSDEKRLAISKIFSEYKKGKVEIRVFENRGRDIAPKLVGFSDVYARYDVAVCLHTKKSPHGGTPLSMWRQYLYEHLLGSPAVVESIFELLRHDRVGFVFPQHLPYLRTILGWGSNYPNIKNLLARMGLHLRRNISPEFPSGSMFWCRTDALQKLLSLKLKFSDFDEESGQIDGTLAHAIERTFLFAAEGSGYTWAKISLPALYPLQSTLIPVSNIQDVATGMPLVYRKLLQD